MSTEAFRAFLLSRGLQPGAVAPDGRWRRCPTENHPQKKNGSYKLACDGLIGWCQDFATDSEPAQWRPERQTSAVPFDAGALARAHAEAERQRRAATEGARVFYAACDPLRGGHPYLDAHGLSMEGCFGLKVDRSGWLVVPALIGRDLMSVQRISPEGEKRFWTGAPVQRASYVVERRNAAITVLCEGLATGLAIYAAAPLTRIVVAFNSGNLTRLPVARSGMLCVAADNDWETEARLGSNPGLKAATEAAEALGVGVAAPQGIRGSDWADFRSQRVLERLEKRPHGSRETESTVRRAVDGEIAAAIQRAARLPKAAP